MKFTLLIAGLALFSFMSCKSSLPNQKPIGESMPVVSGEDLDGTAVTLPKAQEPMILLVGYVQEAQFDLDRWILGLVQLETPLPILEVPTIPGMLPGLAAGWIDEGMRGGIPPEDWASVVTVYGAGAKELAAFTGTELANNGRVLLLDGAGRVVWFADRGYSATGVSELDARARALVGAPQSVSAGTRETEGMLFDFGTAEASSAWSPVDDRVMGGSSRSRLEPVPSLAAFTGELVVEGGGFAQVRVSPEQPLDLSDAERVELLVRGDGRTYQLRLGDDGRFDGVRWTASFQPALGQWQMVELALDELTPTWRGRTVRGAGDLARDHVTSLGLLLADGEPGDFRLEVRWIRAAK